MLGTNLDEKKCLRPSQQSPNFVPEQLNSSFPGTDLENFSLAAGRDMTER